MASSSANKVRLLRPGVLTLAIGAVAGLLLLTYHGEEVFLPDGKQPDALSANYAELLLEAHPEDASLRESLIRLLVDLGDYARASLHLDQWSRPDPLLSAYYRLEIDALTAQRGNDQQALERAQQRMLAFDRSALSAELLERMARHALILELPGLAAEIHETLAGLQPEQAGDHLRQAARWYMAAGQPHRAAPVYQRLLAQEQDPEERRRLLRQSYEALLAAGKPEQAAALIVEHLASPEDLAAEPELLASAISSSMGTRRLDLAERIVGVWRQLQPNDPAVLQADFDLHLGFGDIHGAWATGQTLLAHRPADPELLRQMAQLGEWTGHTSQALDYWIRYLAIQPDGKTLHHAWQLSMQLYDFDRGIPLLYGLVAHRRLEDREIDALMYAHESRGTPEQAERWLRDYLEQYPEHRLAWQRLILNLENTHQAHKELEVWPRYAARFDLSVDERVEWALLHWHQFDPRGAWHVLDVDVTGLDDRAYWNLRAAVAWELEDDEQLLGTFEQMRARGFVLDYNQENQLVGLYRKVAPRKALALLGDSWERRGDPRRLLDALHLAEELQDWPTMARLLESARKQPAVAGTSGVIAARARLAQYLGHTAEAERLYRLGLGRFPGDGRFREGLLWLLIEQQRRDELPILLSRWQSDARRDGRLWLPFASASQLLGRHSQALAWYQRHIQARPGDLLVLAAYADALDQSGRFDQAQRLRHRLVAQLEGAASVGLTPQHYSTWLRLQAVSHSPAQAQRKALQWQDGSPAMLQLWFDSFIAQLDAVGSDTQKDDWLAWARARGLQVDSYQQIQQALRHWNRPALQELVEQGALDSAQRVEALQRLGQGDALQALALSELDDSRPLAVRQQLWRQAVEMLERSPQGMQLAWQRRDFGGLDLSGPQLSVARYLNDQWYTRLDLSNGSYSASSVDASVLGRETSLLLEARLDLLDGSLSLFLDGSWNDLEDRHGFGLSRLWRLDSRTELQAGLDWHRRSEESGLMRALGRQDSLWLSGRHGFSARDQLSWSVARRRYQTRAGDALGDGMTYSLQFDHQLQFEGPSWALRAGVDYQDNDLRDRRLAALEDVFGGPLRDTPVEPAALLQADYGQIYVGSTWRRGLPGALNRTRGQYTWLVDVMAGWQWTERTLNYGINTGLGMEVLGDDELAMTIGYQSAPRGGDGEAGGVLGASYSLRFGR